MAKERKAKRFETRVDGQQAEWASNSLAARLPGMGPTGLMGQCLALLDTTASSTDRGEDLKIDPDGRIPKRAKSNDQTINPCTFGTPQFSALAKSLIPFVGPARL